MVTWTSGNAHLVYSSVRDVNKKIKLMDNMSCTKTKRDNERSEMDLMIFDEWKK